MQIIEKNIEDLIEYENNPRFNNEAVEYVTESIKNFGFKIPIIIDKNNVIVCGHTRLKSAKQLNIKKVPCIIADDLNEKQIKAFRIADNKVSEYSKWDYEKLELELQELENFEMDVLGFEDEIQEIENNKEVIEDDFEIKIPDKPKSKLGDIYINLETID